MRARLSRTLGRIVLLVLLLGSAKKAYAYRPFDGTDADVAGLGDFELELGPVHYYSQAEARYLIAPATVLNLGFAPRWEAVVNFSNFVALQSVPGEARDRVLDTAILAKTVILPGSLQDAGPWPSVAAELGPLLPEIDGGKGFGASLDVVVSKRWPALALHLNNQLELTRADLHADLFEGLIVEGPIEAPARPVAEVFVEHEWVANVTTVSGLLGGIWRAADGLDLDAGVREARIGDEWATEVRLGLTWTLGLWKQAADGKEASASALTFARQAH
jgi:hypothetical protein